ncbi:hypothetical protein AA309_19715 [Microvirga vignae]|uniref:Uncharacterized protein n=1 Tax=Microvirga vignae TaxID=1225564 RepID=A0A0H1R8V7_9HYPH|nr:hypothetical protein AA309_19715 [Microvirga vignae]
MRHKFQVGQPVVPASPRQDRHHIYYIIQLIPETSHTPQYRVQEVTTGVTCVVLETDINAVEAQPT